jgi:hypothetical protein
MEEAAMDPHVQQEIKEILEYLDAQTNPTMPSIDENQQGTEVIDVFIVRRQVEEPEPSTVASMLADTSNEQRTQAAPAEQETTEPPLPPLPLKPRRYALPYLIGALCLLLAVALGITTLLLVFAPSATVTIIPASTQFATTRTVTIVSTKANAAQQQIPGRLLEMIALSQAKTVPATGTGHQQAQAAHGFITFYNALPTPQTIPAGELLTGADRVEVVTLQDTVIPAGTLATNGQITVTAQAVNVGPQGNIAAGDIYGKCCRDDVFVSNSPFHGGQDARSYHMVTQQDINGVPPALKTSLDQSVQAALSQQVHPNETLVTPVPCATSVTSDHKAGSEASHVQVTVSENCTGEVYDTSALHDLLMRTVTQQAAKQLGNGYSPVDDLQTSITQATIDTRLGTATLQVKAISTWVYQFSSAQQQQIKLTIKGKSKSEATALLLHTPGVQTVSLFIKNVTTIPTDVQQIHLVFVETL